MISHAQAQLGRSLTAALRVQVHQHPDRRREVDVHAEPADEHHRSSLESSERCVHGYCRVAKHGLIFECDQIDTGSLAVLNQERVLHHFVENESQQAVDVQRRRAILNN